VEAQRPGFPDVEMNPAPGFDARMPHDLMHLVVEAQLGLKSGIFGQLAAGGDAGTFHISLKPGEHSRAVSRARRRVATRGKKLMSGGRDDCLRSEQAAFICWQEWHARSSSSKTKKHAHQSSALNQDKLDEICEHLDQLSARWLSLRIGESIAVAWPGLAIVTP
jgi:hypothetical protein